VHRDFPMSLPSSEDALVGASGALAAITQAHSLSDTERERLKSSYESIGEFLSEHPFFGGLTVEVHPQGSMAIGTTTKPEGKAEFDVDLVARLTSSAHRQNPVHLLEKMDDAMGEYAERHDLDVEPKRRCTQVQYANAMHTDVTPVIDWPSHLEPYGDVAGLVPDRERGEHLGTNPRGYVRFFNDAAAFLPRFSLMESRQALAKADVLPLPGPSAWAKPLARYVQLFKIHRNILFAAHPELAPTSTFITTQVVLAYADLVRPGVTFQSPAHLLLAIFAKMPEYVTVGYRDGREHWVLCNPTHRKENLADRMNSGDRQDAYRQWRQRLVRDVAALSEMYLPGGAGLKAISNSVQSSFGARASKALTDSYAAGAARERTTGVSRILVPTAGAATAVLSVPSRAHTFYGD
jgi:hypothetical protein